MTRVAKTAHRINFFEGAGKNLEKSKRGRENQQVLKWVFFGHLKKIKLFFQSSQKKILDRLGGLWHGVLVSQIDALQGSKKFALEIVFSFFASWHFLKHMMPVWKSKRAQNLQLEAQKLVMDKGRFKVIYKYYWREGWSELCSQQVVVHIHGIRPLYSSIVPLVNKRIFQWWYFIVSKIIKNSRNLSKIIYIKYAPNARASCAHIEGWFYENSKINTIKVILKKINARMHALL